MGTVYLAEHRLLKRPCALKVIRPERAGDARALERFEHEVRATARLSDPHIVEVYDYGRTEDGTFYYVMEHLRGLSLHQLVARHGPQPPGRVIYLLRQACEALMEAHAAGLVHRDLTPANPGECGLHPADRPASVRGRDCGRGKERARPRRDRASFLPPSRYPSGFGTGGAALPGEGPRDAIPRRRGAGSGPLRQRVGRRLGCPKSGRVVGRVRAIARRPELCRQSPSRGRDSGETRDATTLSEL